MSLLNGTRRALLTRRSGAFTGAYDAYESSLVHVYEPARRVLTSYTGDLVCLRRDSDDTQECFGYDANGNLDTAAIQSWLDADGASNAYVVTVYDQKGGDDVTQADENAQPLYVASLQNGRPGMRLNGTSHFLRGAFTSSVAQPLTIHAVGKLDTSAVNDDNHHNIVECINVNIILRARKVGTPDTFSMYAGSWIDDGASTDDWLLWTFHANSASSELFLNGSGEASGNAGSNALDGVAIGGPNPDCWEGDIVSVIIRDSVGNRTGMESTINAYWGIF
jgi:hypothetical protein